MSLTKELGSSHGTLDKLPVCRSPSLLTSPTQVDLNSRLGQSAIPMADSDHVVVSDIMDLALAKCMRISVRQSRVRIADASMEATSPSAHGHVLTFETRPLRWRSTIHPPASAKPIGRHYRRVPHPLPKTLRPKPRSPMAGGSLQEPPRHTYLHLW